jgi:hypothetical protein
MFRGAPHYTTRDMGQIETLAREVLDDISTMGPARLFHYARVLLHGQVVFGMIGCLTMVYGTIHPGQVACALFGIVAVDLKHAPMMRSYAWLVTFLLLLDVIWHHFWAERLLRNYTGVKEEKEMWWGLMVANTNKFCGFGMEMVCGFLRLASVPIWFMLWNGNYLSGSAPGDAQEVMASVSNVPVRDGYEMVQTKGPGEY